MNELELLHYKVDKREPRGWWAPGEYLRRCFICGCGFIGDKRAAHCADCAYKHDDFPEQLQNTQKP